MARKQEFIWGPYERRVIREYFLLREMDIANAIARVEEMSDPKLVKWTANMVGHWRSMARAVFWLKRGIMARKKAGKRLPRKIKCPMFTDGRR